MSKLFVSYHYTARQGNQFYQGYGSMITGPLIFGEPSEDEHIEEIENGTAEHCRQTMGMDSATTVILWWRLLAS